MSNNYVLIKYYIDKARNLSLNFDEQVKESSKLGIGDYFTEDIANEWFADDIKPLNELLKKNLISYKAVELYSLINANFDSVSLNGNSPKKEIWTLAALKKHSFWKQQRLLAKELLNELIKFI